MDLLQKKIQQAWYRPLGWNQIFLPLSWAFERLAKRRRGQFINGQRAVTRVSVPVIVVGNVSVGGTGKSPLVIYLIDALRRQGWQPGVVSRGYGASVQNFPCQVTAADEPANKGDEPVMIVRRTDVPLVIDPDRGRAADYLLAKHCCDVIISDDGLQHYALARDIEIAVVDGQKGLGNGYCLPVGPLREPPSRLNEVDMIVLNQAEGGNPLANYNVDAEKMFSMAIVADGIYPLACLKDSDSSPIKAERLNGKVHGVAGIGNPDRFFGSLRQQGLEVIEHRFADHYQYQCHDLQFGDGLPVVMTEKDAVKCIRFELENCHYLKVSSQVEETMMTLLMDLLTQVKSSLEASAES